MCAATVASLRKGGNVTLSALADELGSVSVMLEWAVENGRRLDADVSALLVGDDGKVRSNDDLVFYNQRSGADGAVRLRGKVSIVAERFTAFADIIDVDVDDLADSIEKVVLAASMDPGTGGTFGQLGFLRLRLLRSSDSTELLRFDIQDATSERVFVFGEIYRRGGQWKFRAVGQGYDAGLAALVTDYGIEVDDPATAAPGEPPGGPAETDPFAAVLGRHRPPPGPGPAAQRDAASPVAGSHVDGLGLSGRGDSGLDDGGLADGGPGAEGRTDDGLGVDQGTERIDTRKWSTAAAAATPFGAAGTGADADPSERWQPARLFPVAGIGGAQEQERRATSALLAVLGSVDELGMLFRQRMNAPPRGRLMTFTEVPFTLDGSAYRPDGVIRVERRGRPWIGLVEVKTGKNNLDERQLAAYLRIARAEGFDGLLTISNQITPVGENHPLTVGQTVAANTAANTAGSMAWNPTGEVGLHHFSWAEIRYHCQLLSKRDDVTDATQAYVLRELLRYLEHPRSGAQIFEDMGPHWVRVRDSVVRGTLRPTDRELPAVIERFDQLTRYLCLHLGGRLGVEIAPQPHAGMDGPRRREHLADELCRRGTLSTSLAVPGVGGALGVSADLRTSVVTCSVSVEPPLREHAVDAVAWIVRQLDRASGSLRVEAVHAAGPGADGTVSRVELLSTVRRRPASIILDPQAEILRFVVSAASPLGSKRGRGKATFITSVVTAVEKFHKVVVARLAVAAAGAVDSPAELPGGPDGGPAAGPAGGPAGGPRILGGSAPRATAGADGGPAGPYAGLTHADPAWPRPAGV